MPTFNTTLSHLPLTAHRPTEEEIRELETQNGGQLPEEYRIFLKEVNGLVFLLPTPWIQAADADPDDEEDSFSVDVLYGILMNSDFYNPNYNLKDGSDGYDFKWKVPECYIAIGEDSSWNRICVSLAKNTFGQIFLWEPGEPWEFQDSTEGRKFLRGAENVRTDEYLRPVAKTFTDLWRLINETEYFGP